MSYRPIDGQGPRRWGRLQPQHLQAIGDPYAPFPPRPQASGQFGNPAAYLGSSPPLSYAWPSDYDSPPPPRQYELQTFLPATPSSTSLGSPPTPYYSASAPLLPRPDPTERPYQEAAAPPFLPRNQTQESQYPRYLGTSVQNRPRLTWRPLSMEWAYLLLQIVLLSLSALALLKLSAYSIAHYGFSETAFEPLSLRAQATFRILPTTIGLGFYLAWAAIDEDFKRLTPFINMANLSPASRNCCGRKNEHPGARGRDSLLLDYFPYLSYTKEYFMCCRNHWAVAASATAAVLLLSTLGALSALVTPQYMYPPVPVDGNAGLRFRHVADWQQQLDGAYPTSRGRQLAISELSLVLNVSVEATRKWRSWYGGRWSVLPYVLHNETNGDLQKVIENDEIWQADTVVFHGTLACVSATAQTEAVPGGLRASFQDAAGCSVQQMYPTPPAGQYLSFWNTTDPRTANETCRYKQFVAWGKASSPRAVDWTAISCSPTYRTATTTVRYGPVSGLQLRRKQNRSTERFTSSIDRSVFPDVDSQFSSPPLTDFIAKVLFESGLAAVPASHTGQQGGFFRGKPQLARLVDLEALREGGNLTATAQLSFERMSARIFSIALSAINPAALDSQTTVVATSGTRSVRTLRWAVNPGIALFVGAMVIPAILCTIGLFLSVILVKKYRVTGLRFDITATGTAGLMLLLCRSGKVLDVDFRDLDQSTERREVVKRLGEKMYRLGYWEDGNGKVFWGIGREAGEKGVARQVAYNEIPRIPPEKLKEFRHRQGRPELRGFFIVATLTIAVGLAAFCMFLAVTSRRHDGLSPILDSNSVFRMTLLWVFLPSCITTYIFRFWWRMVDMYFRCTEPFVGLTTPRPAHKNICLDYRTVMMITLPFKAAWNRHWKLALVSWVTVLATIMVGVAGSLFLFDYPRLTSNARFFPTHKWKVDGFATPTVEPYLYQAANILRGSGAMSSWTDNLAVYLPMRTDNRAVWRNMTKPRWNVETQRVWGNLTGCIDIGADVVISSTNVKLGGSPGSVIDSVSLKTGGCAQKTITGICGKAVNGSAVPSGLCSSWTLLDGNCGYAGRWWIHWQSGKGLGYDSLEQPVFAAGPPVYTSLLCDTSIWRRAVNLTVDSETRVVSRGYTIGIGVPALIDGGSSAVYRNTFNSLLRDALTTTRSTTDATDIMATMMEGLMPNRTNLSIPDNLMRVASVSYANVFSIYTRNEEILWTPLSDAEVADRAVPGTVSWRSMRIFIRNFSFALYVVCLLIFIVTITLIGSSIKQRRLPRQAITIADMVTYFYRSPGILDDFRDLHDVESEKELATRVRLKGRAYVFGQGTGRDGVKFMGIGDADTMEYEGKGRRRRRWLFGSFG